MLSQYECRIICRSLVVVLECLLLLQILITINKHVKKWETHAWTSSLRAFIVYKSYCVYNSDRYNQSLSHSAYSSTRRISLFLKEKKKKKIIFGQTNKQRVIFQMRRFADLKILSQCEFTQSEALKTIKRSLV